MAIITCDMVSKLNKLPDFKCAKISLTYLSITICIIYMISATYFLKTSKILRLTPVCAHVFTGFGQFFPRIWIFSRPVLNSSTSVDI